MMNSMESLEFNIVNKIKLNLCLEKLKRKRQNMIGYANYISLAHINSV